MFSNGIEMEIDTYLVEWYQLLLSICGIKYVFLWDQWIYLQKINEAFRKSMNTL